MTNFATTFNKLRKSKGLTQKELAKALDVTQTAITYWETGKREPSIEMLEKIANYFDVSLDYLFTAQTDKRNLKSIMNVFAPHLTRLKNHIKIMLI